MPEISAIILAAGESKRMGFPKMLLIFNGKTMLETVIENVIRSSVDNTIVVLGAERERLTEIVRKLPVRFCYNNNYKKGMLSSVKCGIQNLPSEPEAVLFFQGDQPLVSSDVINVVIEKYRLSDKGIVVPVYNNKRGHPLLLAGKYLKEIAEINPSEGLRSLAYMFPEDVLEVETNDPGILRDFDTFNDYKTELNKML